MNERIKLLKEQAMEWVPNMADPDTKIRLLNAEKFAELIVRECIDTVQKRYMGDNNREDMEVRKCVQDLKQHFGVEE
jgi:uncharacterized protein YlzI (FlbEa/FlbD family)